MKKKKKSPDATSEVSVDAAAAAALAELGGFCFLGGFFALNEEQRTPLKAFLIQKDVALLANGFSKSFVVSVALHGSSPQLCAVHRPLYQFLSRQKSDWFTLNLNN